MGDQFIPLAFKDDAYRAVIASQTTGDLYYDEAWTGDDWYGADLHAAPVSLDSLPAFIAGPPAGGEADEPKAAQWDNDGYYFESVEDGWLQSVYGFPDQVLDAVSATLFPPDVTTDFLATQLDPSVGQDNQDPGPQTEDYSNDTTVDSAFAIFFQPPVTEEFFAQYPLAEQPWFPDAETEDYADAANDDIVAQLFPPAPQDDSYVATLDLPQFPDFTEPDWEFSPFLEQNEGYLSPNDAFDVTIATQPHYGELPIPEEQTEDYANDSTVDTSWAMDFASGDEITIATQPLSEQPWFPDQETEEFAYEPTPDITPQLFPPPIAGDDLQAAQPTLEPFWSWADPELEDYQQFADQIEGYLSPNDAPDVTTAATWFLPEHPEPDPEFIPDAAVDQAEGVFFPQVADDSYIATVDVLADPQWPTEDDGWPWTSTLEDGAVQAYLLGDDGVYAAQDLAPDPQWPTEDDGFDWSNTLNNGAEEAWENEGRAFRFTWDPFMGHQFLPFIEEDYFDPNSVTPLDLSPTFVPVIGISPREIGSATASADDSGSGVSLDDQGTGVSVDDAGAGVTGDSSSSVSGPSTG